MSAFSPPTLDLAHRDDLRWLAELLADVRRAVPAAEPLLVGALARDLLLHYGHGIPVARATEDVDLAFAVGDWQAFASVREALLAGGAFAPYRGAIQKLRHGEHGFQMNASDPERAERLLVAFHGGLIDAEAR